MKQKINVLRIFLLGIAFSFMMLGCLSLFKNSFFNNLGYFLGISIFIIVVSLTLVAFLQKEKEIKYFFYYSLIFLLFPFYSSLTVNIQIFRISVIIPCLIILITSFLVKKSYIKEFLFNWELVFYICIAMGAVFIYFYKIISFERFIKFFNLCWPCYALIIAFIALSIHILKYRVHRKNIGSLT